MCMYINLSFSLLCTSYYINNWKCPVHSEECDTLWPTAIHAICPWLAITDVLEFNDLSVTHKVLVLLLYYIWSYCFIHIESQLSSTEYQRQCDSLWSCDVFFISILSSIFSSSQTSFKIQSDVIRSIDAYLIISKVQMLVWVTSGSTSSMLTYPVAGLSWFSECMCV